MKWPWPWLQAKGADEKLVSTWGMSEEGQPYSVTRLPGDMNSICRTESQTASWHPHRHLASPHSASSPVRANKHSFPEHTAARWWTFGLRLSNVPDSWVTKPGLEGMLPWERHSEHQQSSRLYQTCLIQTLYMEPVSFRAHWMPLSVLQVQQDTAGER